MLCSAPLRASTAEDAEWEETDFEKMIEEQRQLEAEEDEEDEEEEEEW